MRNKLLVILVATLALSGCRNVMYQNSEAISNKNWEAERNISFDVEVTDTVNGFDFYIDLRNESSYQYANIYMFVNSTFPNGKSARDTVECFLTDKTGRWLGSGLGDIIDNHILFKENVRFPNAGTYTFSFEHGMREESLSGILDVGISLETHQAK